MTESDTNLNDSELDTLIQDLEDLRIEFIARSNILQHRIERLSTRNTTNRVHQPKRNSNKRELSIQNPFTVNDRVRITIPYKGRIGTLGTVIKVTPKQVRLRLDNGTEIRKSILSIEKVVE